MRCVASPREPGYQRADAAPAPGGRAARRLPRARDRRRDARRVPARRRVADLAGGAGAGARGARARVDARRRGERGGEPPDARRRGHAGRRGRRGRHRGDPRRPARAARLRGPDGRRIASRPTSKKTRLVAQQQQIVRVDQEKRHPIDGAVADRVCRAIDDAVRGAQALVLSDYAKGVVTPEIARHAIDAARAAGIPVVVDPKQRDFADLPRRDGDHAEPARARGRDRGAGRSTSSAPRRGCCPGSPARRSSSRAAPTA